MSKTIGIIIIGDDILQGNGLDLNLNYVVRELVSLHYKISKVSVIPGDEDLITFEAEHLLKQCDFVLLIDKLMLNSVYSSLANLFKDDLLPCSKLSYKDGKFEITIPKSSKILEYDNSIKVHPVIYLNRLFIVHDGNLRLVFENILKAYFKQFNRKKSYKKKIYTNTSAKTIYLNDQNSCGVQYSCYSEGNLLVVEAMSSDLDKLVEFERQVEESRVNVIGSRDCSNIAEEVYDFHCFSHVRVALECIEKCLLDYGPENVFLSFNGGKDCTVLLHLVLGVLRKKYPHHGGRLTCMYVQSANPFEEVNDFIEKVRRYYSLEIVTITKGVKEGLTTFLEERPHMRACLMGTRSTDPYSEHLVTFQMTDANWPQVMRVSPLLQWRYADIWDYLLYFQVPYCVLYDEGYTSLGSVDNTLRNPDLLYGTTKGKESYLPAYKLLDGFKERSGRQ